MNVVAFVLRAVQLGRAAGLVVTFEPGWETRGNGQTAAYVGEIEHHTAVASSLDNPFPSRWTLRDGRSDLSGPLCNSAGPADGSIHIVAAHPANHAGASGGRSMGPLPVTTTFNKYVWGHEIDYAGTEPMLPGAYRAAVIWARCVLLALVEYGQIPAFAAERARAHAETSITGKWDPGYAWGKTINMAAFRESVAEVEDDVQLTDPLAPFSWNGLDFGGDPFPVVGAALANLHNRAGTTELAVRRIEATLAALSGTLSDDEANILAAVRNGQDPAAVAGHLAPLLIEGGMVTRLGDDQLTALVQAVADEQDRRAAARANTEV